MVRLALVCAAVLAASVAAAQVRPALRENRSKLYAENEYVHTGESLLHGVSLPDRDTMRHMPLVSVLFAAACNHLPEGAQPWAAALPALLLALLVFVSTRFMLGSARPAALAVLLLFVFGQFTPPFYFIQAGYAVMVMLVGAACLWRVRRPSPASSLLLGLAVGLSVLYRSPLAFWPLVLAAYEIRASRRRRGAAPLWPIFVVPCLLLIPWIWMNWAIHGEFVPFERGQAHVALLAASAGPSIKPSFWSSAPVLGVLAQSVGHIAAHPLIYAVGVVRRIGIVVGIHPLLFALAGAGFWRRRDSEEARQLALLAIYFILIHACILVLHNYFIPLWPLLCVLAAGLVAVKPQKPVHDRLFGGVVTALLAVASVAGAFSLARVVVFGLSARAEPSAALERALAAHPEDPWLLTQRGRLRLRGADAADGLRDLRAGLLLSAGLADAEFEHAWALAGRGFAQPFFRFPLPQESMSNSASMRGHMLKAVLYRRRGRLDEVREELRAAVADKSSEMPPGAEFQASKEQAARHRPLPALTSERDFFGTSLKERLSLADELTRLPSPDPSEAWVQKASVALALRDRRGFEAALSRAQALGAPDRGLRWLDPPSPEPTDACASLSGQAKRAIAEGRRDEAAAALARASGLKSSKRCSIDVASLYRDLGRPERALAIFSELAEKSARDPQLWISKAYAASDAGRRQTAKEALEAAEKTSRGPDDAYLIAVAYQSLAIGRPDGELDLKALSLFERLVADHPLEPKFLAGRAALHMTRGRREQAKKDWDESVRLGAPKRN